MAWNGLNRFISIQMCVCLCSVQMQSVAYSKLDLFLILDWMSFYKCIYAMWMEPSLQSDAIKMHFEFAFRNRIRPRTAGFIQLDHSS